MKERISQAPALVTGASGFLGRHLVRALLDRNRPVFAHCRHTDLIGDLVHPLMHPVQGDLRDPSSYESYLSDEITVFHLAALRNKPGTAAEDIYRTNEEACLALGRLSARSGVPKFIYVSTALAFGPSSDGRQVTEEEYPDVHGLNSNYIESKVRALTGMKELVSKGLYLVTVCPAIVFGPDHPGHPNRLTTYMRYLLRYGVDVFIGKGDRLRTIVFVQDIIHGLLHAERLGIQGEEYILGGEDVSHRKLNKTILSIAGAEPRFSFSVTEKAALTAAGFADMFFGYDSGSGYKSAVSVVMKEWCYNSQKAEMLLGYASTPLEEGIRKTIEFIREEKR